MARTRWFWGTAAILAVGGGLFLGAHPQTAPAPGRHGILTASQVLAQSEPITRAMAADASVQLSAEPLSVGVGRDRRYWQVEGLDDASLPAVYLIWDADSGDLYAAGHLIRPGTPAGSTIRSRADAVMASWSWLKTLGMSRQAPVWRPGSATEARKGVWRVHWRAAGHAAVVGLDGPTGDVTMARCWHTGAATLSPRAATRPRLSILACR